MPTNREIAESFAAQFNPPLPVVKTEHINMRPVQDAWCITFWDAKTRRGVTAHVMHGRLHAYLETEVGEDGAEAAGAMIAKALGMGAAKWDIAKLDQAKWE